MQDTSRGERTYISSVLFVDIVGYSKQPVNRQVEWKARFTEQLAAVLADIPDAERVVVDSGDGAAVCFLGDPQTAMSCALELGTSLHGDADPQRSLPVRMGINTGPLRLVRDANGIPGVVGDAINVAARVMGFAGEREILVSRSYFEMVASLSETSSRSFVPAGVQADKHGREHCLYRLQHADGSTLDRAPSASQGAGSHTPASIAVLPFTNLSADPEQEYFVDGVVDDIISALARLRWWVVIARNSTFTYKGKAVDVKQVGRELSVQYVLEGSIRKAGDRVRIVGQLVETERGGHLWADRFEGNFDDIFELQDRITSSVISAIQPRLALAEIKRVCARPPTTLVAYDLGLRAFGLLSLPSIEANDEAIALLRRAAEMEPDNCRVNATAALAYTRRKAQYWATPADVEEGLRFADAALAKPHDDPFVLAIGGFALAFLGFRHDEGLSAVDRALALCPGLASLLTIGGWTHAYVGDAHTAIAYFQRAMRLSPLDPDMYWMQSGIAWAYLVAGNDEPALLAAEQAIQTAPWFLPSHVARVVALVGLGRMDEATGVVDRIRALAPTMTLTAVRQHLRQWKQEEFRERCIGALRLAGVPE